MLWFGLMLLIVIGGLDVVVVFVNNVFVVGFNVCVKICLMVMLVFLIFLKGVVVGVDDFSCF